MNNLYYLLLANLIIWIALFGYMHFINRKQNRIEEKIKVLRQK